MQREGTQRRAASASSSAPTLSCGPALSASRVLGDRYRIEEFLGRGGMGEVWLAFDLKLRVEVALKVVSVGADQTAPRVEQLRREVRAARDVTSPHVCRVFDLIEIDGHELVSMEYIDGMTLAGYLEAHGPLELDEARRVASQMLAGLQAIHDAGLIHRDLKPANVMITRAGRVVVMDFGLAKGLAETQTMAVVGTPAYMAPEQIRGGALGVPTDVFAVGVVLAEMMMPTGFRDAEVLRELWTGLRREPPSVPASPWEDAIRKAVATDPRERFASAAQLERALSEGTARTAGTEQVQPYPGLSSFSEVDAKYFFGRELDVEQVWRRMQRLQMLALIGPSGVGKSSFLRAGLIPALPQGWAGVIVTPGSRPFLRLAEALAPALPSDANTVRDLLHIDDPDIAVAVFRRWRRAWGAALLILDQFEELFTLNATGVQSRFAELLGRLALEADVHILLSLRDDFFFHCHEHHPLAPVCREVMMLGSLEGAALRQALVQPALLCGYRFESEELIEAMLAEVEGERGALPLLAFAATQLWERRDRTRGLITRQAYQEVGRVGGALARHAEATLERIGLQHEPVVREIFRHLVTAQGTRVVREQDELLSVFDDRAQAEEVLRTLVDTRLLTSFEAPGGGDETGTRHRIEIVHESLLSAWPRLVRWQTQDADGAQLRDQLRQAAQLWEQRNRSEDLLWTGTAYQEYALWRDRYEGGLTENERAFGDAMDRRARSQRRRRQIGTTAAFGVLLVALMVVGGFWKDARHHARVAEAIRFEEFAMSEVIEKELGDNSAALAAAIASLERGDTRDRRDLAIRALWKGPTRFLLSRSDEYRPAGAISCSPDGKWLATGSRGPRVLVWPANGGPPRVLPVAGNTVVRAAKFSPGGRWLLTYVQAANDDASRGGDLDAILWDTTTWEQRSTWKIDRWGPGWFHPDETRLLCYSLSKTSPYEGFAWRSLDDTGLVRLGSPTIDPPVQLEFPPLYYNAFHPSRDLRWLVSWEGEDLFVSAIGDSSLGRRIQVGREEVPIKAASLDDQGDLVSSHSGSHLRIWSRVNSGPPLVQAPSRDIPAIFDREGAQVFTLYGSHLALMSAYDLRGPIGSRAQLYFPRQQFPDNPVSLAGGNWVALGSDFSERMVYLYPRRTVRPFSIDLGIEGSDPTGPGRLAPDGRRVVVGLAGEVMLIDLETSTLDRRVVFTAPEHRVLWMCTFDRTGQSLLVGTFVSGAWLVPLTGGEPRLLRDAPDFTSAAAFSPSGELLAVGGGWTLRGEERYARVLDREGRLLARMQPDSGEIVNDVAFLSETELVVAMDDGLRAWSTESNEVRLLGKGKYVALSVGEHVIAACTSDELWIYDRSTLTGRPIENVDARWVSGFALAPDESFVVMGKGGGAFHVKHFDEAGIHVLPGPRGFAGQQVDICDVRIDAHGRWISAIATDGQVVHWPVPRGRPLRDRPLEEFLSILRAQTNIRAEVDASSPRGYRFVASEFPGWETVPSWQDWYSEEFLEDPPWKPMLEVE